MIFDFKVLIHINTKSPLNVSPLSYKPPTASPPKFGLNVSCLCWILWYRIGQILYMTCLNGSKDGLYSDIYRQDRDVLNIL